MQAMMQGMQQQMLDGIEAIEGRHEGGGPGGPATLNDGSSGGSSLNDGSSSSSMSTEGSLEGSLSVGSGDSAGDSDDEKFENQDSTDADFYDESDFDDQRPSLLERYEPGPGLNLGLQLCGSSPEEGSSFT
jgi:hypothetical protein